MEKVPVVSILGVNASVVTIKQARAMVVDWVSQPSKQPHYIVKPYVEFMTQADAHLDMQRILNSADLCVPDGVSLQWGASFLYGKPSSKPTLWKLIRSALVWIQRPKWLNQVVPERFAGIDFTLRMLDDAQKHNWKVGVIGGSKDTQSTDRALRERWPNLNLYGVWSGYSHTTTAMDYASAETDDEFMAIIDQIKQQKLDILFVAMGFPRQELFMNHYKDELNVRVMVGEGGSFDYKELGGIVGRAPQLFRATQLEWLWRLLRQPKRIKRQLSVPIYTWRIYRTARANWLREKTQK